MSKRGTPLGGKYKGILEKIVDGETRYQVVVSVVEDGRRRYVRRTTNSLALAYKIKRELEARKTLNQLPGGEDIPMLGAFVEQHIKPLVEHNKWPADPLRCLAEVVAFFGEETTLDQISTARVNKYRNFLECQPCGGVHRGTLSRRSRDHRLVQLARIINLAKKAGYIRIEPLIKKFGKYGTRVSTLTPAQFKRLMANLPEPPVAHRAIMLMGAITGQRRTDLLHMQRGQIRDGVIRYYSSKTGKELSIVCPVILQEELDRIAHGNNTIYLFPNPRTLKPYTDLRYWLKKASAAAGIETVKLHDLRRLCADLVAQETGDALYVQRFIGWSSPDMVNRYTNINNYKRDIAKKIAERLSAANSESQ